MLDKVIALALVAGFATASFAEGAAPAPAGTDKKVEATKAAEPVKAEAAKSDVLKADTKLAANEKHGKHEKHAKKAVKTEAKTEAAAPAPAPTAAPAAK